MNIRKKSKERKLLIDSLVDNAYYIAKKAKYYQSMREYCRNIFAQINSLNYEDYKKHLTEAFELLNYDVITTKIGDNEYIVISRNLEKILIYVEQNLEDLKSGYFSQAITVSFAYSILHCTSKCVVTKLQKNDISKEYASDCNTHNISLMDYKWNESIFNLITSNLTAKYEECKVKIKETSDLIIKIKNEPLVRTKEKPRYNLSDIITNNDLKQIEERLELDLMEETIIVN